MAHEITATDSLFVAREPAWHGLGTLVPEALCSADALRVSGIDWDVVPTPLYRYEVDQASWLPPAKVEGWVANVRSDTGEVLGVVGDGYKIVQNRDAFAFTDILLGEGVKYESAGSLKGGKRVWVLARLPQAKLLDDEVDPFLVFTNGHDGNNAVKVCITPVRVVCMNTLNLALHEAPRAWSMTHQGDMQAKLREAEETLRFASSYMYGLQEESERLVDIKITEKIFQEITTELFPLTKDPRRHPLTYEMRKEFMYRYLGAPDLGRFRGTGWGVVNAAADFAGHRETKRKTSGEYRFSQIIGGHPVTDKARELVLMAA